MKVYPYAQPWTDGPSPLVLRLRGLTVPSTISGCAVLYRSFWVWVTHVGRVCVYAAGLLLPGFLTPAFTRQVIWCSLYCLATRHAYYSIYFHVPGLLHLAAGVWFAGFC